MSTPELLIAFSGGLDTSYCVHYLGAECGYRVTTITFDCGGLSDAEQEKIAARSAACGAVAHQVVDMREALCEQVLVPLIRSGYRKGGNYPLCVGAERGLQAEGLALHAVKGGFSAVAHGCTAAGNDQVRFDVTLRARLPEGIEILAPIRDQAPSREEITSRLTAAGIAVSASTTTYSVNTSLWGTTLGGGPLHDPSQPIPQDLRDKVVAEVSASDRELSLTFEDGVPVALDGVAAPLWQLIEQLNVLAAEHGVGRGVHLGDTVLGIKGRIVFEAPGAAVIHLAHRELCKLTLGKWQLFLREQPISLYGQLLHEGLWLDPVMRDIEAYLASEQQVVAGTVTVRLGRGTLELVKLDSPHSRMAGRARYGETGFGWDGRDTQGFARILSLGLVQGSRAQSPNRHDH